MRNYIIIGCGGFLGSVVRYKLSRVMGDLFDTLIPVGTLSVNLFGSFLIGIIIGLFDRSVLDADWKMFLATGFCGGFTTFSAFSAENVELIKAGNLLHSASYILISVIICLIGTFAGYYITSK